MMKRTTGPDIYRSIFEECKKNARNMRKISLFFNDNEAQQNQHTQQYGFRHVSWRL